MSGIVDQPVIDTRALFRPERQALLDLLSALSPAQWSLPTVCEGWSVHDVAVHLLWVDISNVSRRRDAFFGRPEDDPGDLSDLPALIAFVNALNDNWIQGARRLSPPLLQTLLAVTGEEFAAWADDVDIDALGESIGWAGPEPAPVWLDIAREFTERWVHQQHIRDATGLPGATDARFLRPVLGTFAMALPYALGGATAEDGSIARLVITGDSGGVWSAARCHDRWSLCEPGDDRDADATVIIDQNVAWRLFTRGVPPAQAASESDVSGDPRLIDAILNMVTILA